MEFNSEGNYLAFASSIEHFEIPIKIREYMEENFPGYSIVDSILVARGADENTYELGIIIDNEYVIKVFSEKGEFIKSTRS